MNKLFFLFYLRTVSMHIRTDKKCDFLKLENTEWSKMNFLTLKRCKYYFHGKALKDLLFVSNQVTKNFSC